MYTKSSLPVKPTGGVGSKGLCANDPNKLSGLLEFKSGHLLINAIININIAFIVNANGIFYLNFTMI